MFTKEAARAVAMQFIEDWNTQDLNKFSNYFTENVEIISTRLLQLFQDSNGRIEGRESFRNYWEYMLTHFPNFTYRIHKVEFEENKLLITFYIESNDSYSYGVLHFNEELKIYKMAISNV